MTRIRVIDLETTGIGPEHEVVEIAAVDVVGSDLVIVGSDLVRPSIPIPPEASAVHHILDDHVGGCAQFEDLLPYYLDVDGNVGVEAFAAHNWQFESQWLGNTLGGRPAICTFKCAVRLWPEAPAHNNQCLRYWLRPKGLSAVIANSSHRAFPDAYVTGFLLRELLERASLEELIEWTINPVLLPRITFGKHRGSDWKDVPLDYLDWLIAQRDMNPDVRFTAQHHRRNCISRAARFSNATRPPATHGPDS